MASRLSPFSRTSAVTKPRQGGLVFALKTDPKSDALTGRFPEFGRSDRAGILRVVDIEIPEPINGWIFQRTSELEAGHHALNSSRFDRAPVYHRLSETPPSELDEI